MASRRYATRPDFVDMNLDRPVSHDSAPPFSHYAPSPEQPPNIERSSPTAVCPYPTARSSAVSHDTESSSPSTTIAPAATSCPVASVMQEVDEQLLRISLEARVAYLTDFIGFTSADAAVLTAVAPLVHDLIPAVVDSMYKKLFEFDITKRVFMSRNAGFEGPLPKALEDLTLESAQINFRKVFMKSWARRVLTSDYTSDATWAYMDKVGIMHTGVSPFKHQRALGVPPLNVPYRDCALMLGWVQQVLQTALLSLDEATLPMPQKITACAAVNKVIWVQNDLFSRHYIGE